MNTTAPTSRGWSSADCVPIWGGPVRGASAERGRGTGEAAGGACRPGPRPRPRRARPGQRASAAATGPRLFREALDEVRGGKQRARRAERSQPAVVDAPDVAAAVEPREHAVHREPEVGIAARQHEGVLLDREILVEELVGVAAAGSLDDDADQRGAVRGQAVDLALAEQLEALVAGLDPHDLRGDESLGERLPQGGFGGRAADHRDALSLEVREAARLVVQLPGHARAAKEVDQVEVAQLRGSERPRVVLHSTSTCLRRTASMRFW